MKGKIGLLASVVVCSTALLIASAGASYALPLGVTFDFTAGPIKIIPGTSKSNACHPIILGANNSYILQGPLDYSACGCAVALSVFNLVGNGITLNLNGFTVKGPGCYFDDNDVVNGRNSDNVTVLNGKVSGGQDNGIDVGENSTIIGVNASYNQDAGIIAGAHSLVKDCIIDGNGEEGVETEDGGTVLGSVINDNDNEGLNCDVGSYASNRCTAFGNTLRHNDGEHDGSGCFNDDTKWVTNTSNNCDGVLK